MLESLIGLVLIGAGLLTFTAEIRNWLRRTNIKEPLARRIGILCVLIGLAFIGQKVWSTWPDVTHHRINRSPRKSPPVPPLAFADPAQPGRYFSDDKKCSAEFPGPARQVKLTISSRVQDIAFMSQDGQETYSISRANFSDVDPDSRPTLDSFAEQYRQQTLGFPISTDGKQEIVHDEGIENSGIRGRQIEFRIGPKHHLLAQLFQFEGSIYLITVLIENHKRASSEVDRFFSSVRFASSMKEFE